MIPDVPAWEFELGVGAVSASHHCAMEIVIHHPGVDSRNTAGGNTQYIMLHGAAQVEAFAMIMATLDNNWTLSHADVTVRTNSLATGSLRRQRRDERVTLDILAGSWRGCERVTVHTVLDMAAAAQYKAAMECARWKSITDFYSNREALIKRLMQDLKDGKWATVGSELREMDKITKLTNTARGCARVATDRWVRNRDKEREYSCRAVLCRAWATFNESLMYELPGFVMLWNASDKLRWEWDTIRRGGLDGLWAQAAEKRDVMMVRIALALRCGNWEGAVQELWEEMREEKILDDVSRKYWDEMKVVVQSRDNALTGDYAKDESVKTAASKKLTALAVVIMKEGW